MAEEEEKQVTTQEDKQEQTETTQKLDSSLEEDLKVFMADVQGQITNLTQMIEKNNSVADEPAEKEEEEEPEEKEEEESSEEETDTDEAVEALLNDI